MKNWIVILTVTFGGASSLPCQRSTAPRMPLGYVNEMPSPDRVLASFSGLDSLDRTARQKAAFIVLWRMIEEVSGGRTYSDDEQRVYASYRNAYALVPMPHFDEAESRRLGPASPGSKMLGLEQDLALDVGFRNDLLDRLFPTAWKSNFLAVDARLHHHNVAAAGGPKRSITDSAATRTLGVARRRSAQGKHVPAANTKQGLAAISPKTSVILLGFLLASPMFWHTAKRKKRNRELDRYEFEHRTDGGVVQFATFEKSEEHNRRRRRANDAGIIPGCLGVIGLFMIIGGWIIM